MAQNDFQYGGWNSSTLQCGTWLWDHDIEFVHTSAILEFYFQFLFRPYHRSRHVVHQSVKFYQNRTTPRQKNYIMSIFAYRRKCMS